MKLHLGVIDLPYGNNPGKQDLVWTKKGWVAGRNGKAKKSEPKTANPGSVTTGDVAHWLEDDYHIMEIFYHVREQQIADKLAEDLVGQLENMMMGAPVQTELSLPGAMSFIQTEFKSFLANSDMEKLGYPGVPTKAALDGVNHRLKLKKGPRRPSFIDTGLYQSSFIAWMGNNAKR